MIIQPPMKRHEIEQRIAKRLVRDILAAGCMINVHDGIETVAVCSRDFDHIVSAMFLADIGDTLTVWDMRYQRLGTIDLIYGSGRDVIYEHTDVPLINTLVALARAEVR